MSTENHKPAEVNLILQGKGGVGKSFIASILAQYYLEKNETPLCIDTDPVNATFLGYKALNAHRIELMRENNVIDTRQFDSMMEMIIESEQDVIVDNGAASFIPLFGYLVENNAMEMLKDCGKQVVIHSVITGGQALMDTLNGFSQMVNNTPPYVKNVVWLNEYFGKVEVQDKGFEKLKAYTDNKDKVSGIITIPKRAAQTFEQDIQLMQDKRLTFNEAITSSEFELMAKQRLKMIKKSLFEQLDIVM